MRASLVDQMLIPSLYPDPTTVVQHLQTHISHLFLTDQYVYKIKKPVDFGFLDFTTLEKRHFYCREELRLNRRLSPDIYLEVVALFQGADGMLSFSPVGSVAEYAVKMRRMPEERMMSRLLEQGGVTVEDIDAVADRVALFHAEALRGTSIDLFGTLDAIRNNWLENLRQTEAYRGRTLSVRDHRYITEWVFQRLEQDACLITRRVQDGFIRECDGDLHTENICLDDRIHIFDCIEFNEKFRYGDTAADVAFLAMDLENHGRRDLAERFVDQYSSASGDEGLRQVLPLYLTNRAFIRGKVESFRLDDPLLNHEEKASALLRAQRFFRLARGYAVRENLQKTLFITCGPTGCGKSAMASELCFQLGLTLFSSDIERKYLAGVALTDHTAAIYSDNWNMATYDRLLVLAKEQLMSGRSVVVDATFLRLRDRKRFIRMSADVGAVTVILQISCPADRVFLRLKQRQKQLDAISDGTWQVYQRQMASCEQPTVEEAQLVVLDAVQTTAEMAEQVLTRIGLLTTVE